MLGGNTEESKALAREALEQLTIETLNPEFLGYATLMQAEMLLIQDAPQAALESIEESLERLQEIGVRFFTPQLRLHRARALRMLDRLDEAGETLQESIIEAESMGMRMTLMRALIEVAELAQGSERAAASAAHAQESIQHIVDRIGDDELRQTFLTQSRISDIMRA